MVAKRTLMYNTHFFKRGWIAKLAGGFFLQTACCLFKLIVRRVGVGFDPFWRRGWGHG